MLSPVPAISQYEDTIRAFHWLYLLSDQSVVQTALNTITVAASTMQDTVFSMFGGEAKKEKVEAENSQTGQGKKETVHTATLLENPLFAAAGLLGLDVAGS